ncbi:HAD-IA family hydrolase [Georgenia sp. Z1491]|uniref:HAD-IA family hydrolase n=1 Tax=Georgenia sp. Z1491 TaxID=3416707 RepID=UPI003CE955C0
MRRHLVWDMGGTLVDTYPAVDAALARVVRDRGGEITEREVAALTRRSTGAAVEALSDRFGIPAADLEAAQTDLKAGWVRTPPPVMTGAREAMAAARALGGLNLVVTHRDRASATGLLTSLGLEVDDMLCAPDGHPRKPDPAMYREMLGRHRLEADTCLAVGDRPIDAEAASAAGIDSAVLVTPGLDLDDGGARWRITSLDDVAGLLG